MTTKRHLKTVGTQATVKKVKSLILKENLLTQRFIASKLGTSSSADIDEVQLHMDKASSYTSKSSAAYFAKKESETEIKCTYAFPVDFCVLGLLKRA
ncbi:hypothetical protein TNCV_4376621 [Trichonephila clavipes]|nr:hypothetical protein TNCV_4376621 [Trichonephila clavipes]